MIKKLINYLIQKSGNYNYLIDKERFENLLKKIKIYDCGYNLIRVGDPCDGGYLIPNILDKIDICFSAGVGNNISFENQLKEKNIKCFLADGTVNEKYDHNFIKKNINTFNDENNITINSWIFENINNIDKTKIILKLDIEGAEIKTIFNIDENILKNINILIVEFHDFLYLGNHFGIRILDEIFEKLDKYFSICHIHPNNFGVTKKINNINLPSYLEFTFINNDLVNKKSLINHGIPHVLDKKNNPAVSDIILPDVFYK